MGRPLVTWASLGCFPEAVICSLPPPPVWLCHAAGPSLPALPINHLTFQPLAQICVEAERGRRPLWREQEASLRPFAVPCSSICFSSLHSLSAPVPALLAILSSLLPRVTRTPAHPVTACPSSPGGCPCSAPWRLASRMEDPAARTHSPGPPLSLLLGCRTY